MAKPSYEQLEQCIQDLERKVAASSKSESISETLIDRYGDLFYASPDIVAITRMSDGRLVDINKKFEQTFGISREKAIGKTDADLARWPDRTVRNEMISRINGGKNIRDWRTEQRRPTGETFLVSVSAAPVDIDGEPCLLEHIREIAGLPQTADELKASEERFRLVFNQQFQFMALMQPDGIVLDVNELALRTTAKHRDDYVGKIFWESPAWAEIPDMRTRVEEQFRKALTMREPLLTEDRFQTTTGEVRFARASYTAVRDAEGVVRFVICQASDITEKKHAEMALQKSAAIMDSTQAAVITTDTRGNITYWNKGAEGIYGFIKEEILGAPISTLYKPEDQNLLNTLIERLLSGKYMPTFEVTCIDKFQNDLNILLSLMTLKDEDGNITELVGITKDITELKKMEEEKMALQKQLFQVQRIESIGTLAGGIAHDFNNILSSVIGYSELALDEVRKNSPLEDHIQEIYRAGKRAQDLVRQILSFAARSDDARHPIQLGPIASEVFRFIRSSLPASIDITHHISSSSPILGNPTQLHQIIMNLCTNAAQAMEEEGGDLNISIIDRVVRADSSLERQGVVPGPYVELKVSDTGTGISEDHLDHVFEPYFTTKTISEGTGLGLSVVHGIVESYNGKIVIESVVGKGTDVSIFFPVTDKPLKPLRQEKTEMPAGEERILLVDDEAPIAKISSLMLRQLGYAVTTCTSSVEALKLFRSKPHAFDLIVSDMTMPTMTGDKLAARLLEVRPDVPVILCSGYSKRISPESARRSGIKALLQKPVDRKKLADVVRKVLNGAKDR